MADDAAVPARPRPPAQHPTVLHVTALDVPAEVRVAEAVRRLAGRARVTAWSGAWSRGGMVTCDPILVAAPGDDPFAVLARLPAVAPDPAHPDAVGGGWFGYLAFPAAGAAPFPRFSLAYHRDVLRHDGTRWWFEALLDGSFDAAAAASRCAELTEALHTPAPPRTARLAVTAPPDRTAHVVAVERCVQAVRRGEVYQANIACHVGLRFTGSPHEAFARVVEAHDPARAALVADPAGTAVSAGPELFLRRAGREVGTAPIKGTRPRTGAATDPAERARLAASAKDAAENVMIVDLMRNDLSRVCATGSVRVPALLEVQPHAGVWHLVSTVRGTLADGRDDADLLAATFPPGSVTGAPKIRAVDLIEELEPGPRGLFTGALGYASPLAGLELAVAIRTVEIAPDGSARLGVGGGVTVDSTPVEEWAECLTKAAPVLEALGAAPLDPGPGLRNAGLADPAPGLFETLRAEDGRPLRLADHLRRLRASYGECYGVPLTADVGAAVTAALAGRAGPARVRVSVRPGDPDTVEVTVAPLDVADATAGLVLVPHRLGPAGAERHKFADRGWIEKIEAGLAAGEAALLLDDRDRVLESTRACVFAVRDGVAATPPLDGRLLPGIGRRAVLDAFDAAGRPYDLTPLTLADLAAAEGVFVVSALRGPRWVRAAGGTGWPRPHPLVAWLAGRWAGTGGNRR